MRVSLEDLTKKVEQLQLPSEGQASQVTENEDKRDASTAIEKSDNFVLALPPTTESQHQHQLILHQQVDITIITTINAGLLFTLLFIV